MSAATATLESHIEALEKEIADRQAKVDALRLALVAISDNAASPGAPKPSPGPKPRAQKQTRRYLTTADFELWTMFAEELLRDGQPHKLRAITKAARGAGRVTDTTVSHWVGREVKRGKLHRVGPGLYQKPPLQLTRVAGGAS